MADKKSPFAENEEEVLKQWEEKDIFKKTLAKKSPKGNFVFYEGPPTANGRPGVHHVLTRAFKDIMPRFKTMQGYHVERKAGWDTHGLPVELQVEKELGLSGKVDIEKYGIEKFNKKCKESVWQYKDEWEKLTERIGYWLDLENPYVTYDNEFIESIWSELGQIHERGLLYKGYKVVPQCPRCETALSSHEVAQGYKKVEDRSVYIKFKVKDQENTYILSWTTTPWTLPGNIALAVAADVDYVKLKVGDEYYVLAEALVEAVFDKNIKPVEKYRGKDMVGWEYEPLFPGALDPGDKKAWYVGTADFVNLLDGTGVVHTAAMYGEDDFNFGKELDLPQVHTVDESGHFKKGVTEWEGMFVKDKKVEAGIIKDLEKRGLLLKEKAYEHDYPFCWRCDSPLLYYAKDSWFINMSSLRDELLKSNQTINWEPGYIKDGRFGEWLENVRDWAISRQRYWGTPIPVWECKECEKFDVITSMAELEEKTGTLPKDSDGNVDMHRPFIDTLSYDCECGGKKERVLDVFDVWMDSGSMPLAQHHYPFENKKLIDSGEQYPADFISEAIDQTRGWFYTLLAISTALGRPAPYKNVICLGHIRDKEGKKMSKSKGNAVDPWSVIDAFGVDALRMHLYSINQPGDAKNFDENNVKEVLRKVIMLLGNVVNFYGMYSSEEQVTSNGKLKLENVLDKWIVAKLNELVRDVTNDLNEYHVFEASRRVIAFIDELSTWYVRRSRDRFKEEGADKEQALATLHHVLMTLVKVMAPFTPFVAERTYEKLGGPLESVHLEDWPEHDEKLIDGTLLADMKRARQVVELALAARDEAKIKVRQPLQQLAYKTEALSSELEALIADELNVKEVVLAKNISMRKGYTVREATGLQVSLALEITDELQREGNLRELIRKINFMRKKAGLTINDSVAIHWESKSTDLQIVFNDETLVEELKKSTVSREVVNTKEALPEKMSQEIKINGQQVWIGLKQ